MKKLVLVLLVFLMTGCYDYNELNDLDIISTIIVDYEDDKYVVNLEVLNTSESAEKGSHYVNGTGESLEDAINNIYYDSNYIPFYGHLSVFVMSDTVAKMGMSEFYDYFLRDTDFRKDFYVFVSEDIESILDYELDRDESFGEKAKVLVNTMIQQNGKYRTCNFREIVYHYLRDNPYLMGGIYVDDENIKLSKNYIFQDNKLSFEVEKDVSLFMNMLSGKNEIFQLKNKNTYFIHEYKLKNEFEKNKIKVKLSGSLRLTNIRGADELSISDMRKIEKEFNSFMEDYLKQLIDYSKKKNSDIFFYNYLYSLKYPDNSEKDTWKNIEYEIKSDLKVQEKGMLLEGLEGGKNGK